MSNRADPLDGVDRHVPLEPWPEIGGERGGEQEERRRRYRDGARQLRAEDGEVERTRDRKDHRSEGDDLVHGGDCTAVTISLLSVE